MADHLLECPVQRRAECPAVWEFYPGGMQQLGMHYEYTYEQQWQHRDTPVTFRLYQLNFDSSNIRRYDKYWIISGVHYVEEEPGERRQ